MSPKQNHPARLTDDQLLAYIEGTLDAPAAASVARALTGNPSLERRVLAMRHDRAALQREFAAANDEQAPLDLAAIALETVERAALLNSTPPTAAPAVRSSLPLQTANSKPDEWNADEFSRLPLAPPALARSRRPALWRFVSSRPLASAAGFALLVGGSALVASLMMRTPARDAKSSGISELALSSPSKADIAAQRSLRDSVDRAIADSGTAPPSNNSAAPSDGPSSETAKEVGLASVDPNETKLGEASEMPAAPATAPVTAMSLEHATKLAAQNRLAIRVVPHAKSDPAKLTAALTALAARDSAFAWKLSTTPSPEFASSVLAHLGTRAEKDSSQTANRTTARARRDDPRDPNREPNAELDHALGSPSERDAKPDPGVPILPTIAPTATPPAPPADPTSFAPVRPGVYHAEVAANAAALASLRAALDRADNVDILFEELTDATTLAPALIEQNILWWTQPASAWVRRTTVPIVVEPGR